MIIGNGNIAKALIDRDDVTFFCSGVSDSSCTDSVQFNREADLLKAQDKSKHIVYFSSLGVYRWGNPYMEHKKRMEQLVKTFASYTIVRVEVIEWGTSPKTIINYFRAKIKSGETVELQDTYRSVLSLKEFQYWMQFIPTAGQNEYNITGRLYHVKEMYELIKSGQL